MEGENNNTRRCGEIGEGDDVMSMVDVLNEHARLKADADAVLGASDSHNCTYPNGYLKRQAVYACATCSPNGLAGVCLACSYACHEGHDLYELYTKRNFRCDCGNEKFSGAVCKLYSDKNEPNSRNRYSQNFRGNYCSCSRPYPDPEDQVEDEMVQCVICEDWHHGRHLNTPVPEKDFSEMICPCCMNKNSFLWAYQVLSEETVKLSSKDEYEDNLDVLKTESTDVNSSVADTKSSSVDNAEYTVGNSESNSANGESAADAESTDAECGSLIKHEQKSISAESTSDTPSLVRELNSKTEKEIKSSKINLKREREEPEECSGSTPKKFKHDVKIEYKCKTENGTLENKDAACLLKSLQSRITDHPEKATFWSNGWRQKLCCCDDCLEMYKDKNVEFLLDESDTVQAYEDRGKNSDTEEEVNEASALDGMDRVAQIEVVRGIVDMKTQLNQFLQGFAREGKVVTESDIREFFQSMEQKRRRGQFGVPQPFCR